MRRFRRIRVDREDGAHLPKPRLVVENLSEPEAELLDAASGSQGLNLDNHEGVAMLPSEIELGVRTSRPQRRKTYREHVLGELVLKPVVSVGRRDEVTVVAIGLGEASSCAGR